MSDSILPTVLRTIRALEETVDSLHFIATARDPGAMREEAAGCLRAISRVVCDEDHMVCVEQDRRVGRIHRLNGELAEWQAEDAERRR